MCEDGHISLELDVKILENGSFVYVLRPIKCPEDVTPIVAGVFLSLLFLTAFLLNLMVLVTVATSYTLQRHLYCLLIINLSAACILDCCLNLSVAIGYVTSPPWRFGHTVSYFNSFTINMMSSEVAFAVLLLAGDRAAFARKFVPYQNMHKTYIRIVIVVTWVLAFLLALPLALGVILSMPYRNRYSSSPADPYDDFYLIPHAVLVVIVPTVVMVTFTVLTSVTFHRKRRKQKRVKGSQTIGYFDQILMTPYFRNELYPALFVGLAVLFYVILFLPFTAITIINPMTSQHWMNDTESSEEESASYTRFVPSAQTSARTFQYARSVKDKAELQALNSTTSDGNLTTPITMQEGLIPEIIDTPVLDSVAIWFRFIYHVVVPILVFVLLKDVRAKCEALIMCCRPNSVDVASPKPTRALHFDQLNSGGASAAGRSDQESGKKPSNSIFSKNKNKNNNKNMISMKTPILFSTSDGLHIRTVENTYLDMVENKPLLSFGKGNTATENPKYSYSLCDLTLGYEDLTDFDGQYHIDDHYDFEKIPGGDVAAGEVNDGAANPVVMGANRAAMGHKSSVVETSDDTTEAEGTLTVDYRPPTPPKVQVVGNEMAVNAGDSVDLDEVNNKQPKKGKKVVRFATMLHQEIPRPDSAESSILNSSANSSRSSDSGIMADTEHHGSASRDREERKPRFSISSHPKPGSPTPHSMINSRKPDHQRRRDGKPAMRQNRSRSIPKSREPRKGVGLAPRKPSKASSSSKKGTVVSSKVRTIKSRHMASLESSLTSLDRHHPSSPPPRRFSKHSGQSNNRGGRQQ